MRKNARAGQSAVRNCARTRAHDHSTSSAFSSVMGLVGLLLPPPKLDLPELSSICKNLHSVVSCAELDCSNVCFRYLQEVQQRSA